MRIKIGSVSVWRISEAQAEARRLQIMIDNGNDPCEVKTDKQADKEAAKEVKEAEALAIQEVRESVTVWAWHGLNILPHGSRTGPRAIIMTTKWICTPAELCGVIALNLPNPAHSHHWQRFALLT
jgi:hypothetical protein